MKKRTERPSANAVRAALWLALAGVAAARCGPTADGVHDPDGSGEALTSQGSITATLRRYVESGAGEPYEEFGVAALFPRYRPADAQLVEALLGDRVPSADVAIDQCEPPSLLVQRRPRRLRTTDGTAIELADVGDLSVEYAGQRFVLPTQTFPDLLHAIDGVTYAADDRRGLRFEPAETYAVHASGTDEVARFDVELDAPEDLGDVAIDGLSPSEQIPIVRRGAPLAITWEGDGGYGDEVIATISSGGAGVPLSMSCRMRDDGGFVVPAEMTAAFQDSLVSGEAEMTLSRVRQTAFRAKGLDNGDLSFVLSTSFLVRFDSVP